MYIHRLHAVCVCDTAEYFYQFIDRELEQYGLHGVTSNQDGQPVSARDLISIVDGYKGKGYAKNTEQELGKQLHWNIQNGTEFYCVLQYS